MSIESLSRAQQALAGMDFFPRQWQAVTAPIGPVLVLAGPGAGKTRCIVGRIAYLMEHESVDPRHICAITFTNRAAQEIASRVRQAFGHTAEELTLGTASAARGTACPFSCPSPRL
jgi:superfamily I DNA/RNA helicase